jgi:hypothetical protein
VGVVEQNLSNVMSSRKAVHGLTYSPTLDNGGLVVGNEVEITLDVEMIVPPGK